MKKTKMYAKKSLSLFMAVMMLLTCWVWVAPEHEHASASGANNAAQISATNLTALNSIPSFDTAVTTIHGKYESDSDNLSTQEYDAIYHNVLYTDGTTTISASATSAKTEYGSSWTGSNGVTIYWYHPTATLLYDGDETDLPRLGVAVNTVMYYTGTWSRKTRNYLSYIYSGGNGFGFNENWRGSDGRLNFNYMWHSQPQMMGYTSTVTNENLVQQLKGDSKNHFYANLLKFTGKMSDTEFSRSAQPTFAFYGGNGDNYKTITAKTSDTLYIINYVPLKKALQEALGEGDYANSEYTIANLKANTSKYTTASVAEYVAAVKDLINAKPNNYVDSKNNNVSGYASAASAAVTRFNNAKKNLKLAKYTLTFQRIDGSKKTLDFDYGTEVNCETLGEQLAADTSSPFPNSVENIGNAELHQDYKWDSSTFVTKVTDDKTITETIGGTSAHSFGNATPKDDKNHTRTCSICNYVKSEPHEAVDEGEQTKAPTCTSKGETTYTCKHCNDTYVIADIAELEHEPGDVVIENVVSPSCTEGGSYENVTYCKFCNGDRQSEKMFVPATGHDVKDVEPVMENNVAPTCIADGSYDLVIYCKTCKKEASRQHVVVTALGHINGDPVEENRVKATCTTPGSYDLVIYCTRDDCGEEVSRTKVTVPALGHDIVIDKAVAPTCTETGLTEGQHCSRCDGATVQQDVIPELGHEAGNPVEENRVEANCSKDGGYDTVTYCTRCGTELSRVHTVLPSTGKHYFDYEPNGNGTHTGKCTGCEETDTQNCVEGTPANCVEKAVCSVCNGSYGEVNPNNHKTVVTIPKKDSTCQLEGYEKYERCNACSTDEKEVVIGNKVIIETKAHKYGPWVSNGNNTHTKTCTTCVAANGDISKVTEKCHGGEATCTKQAVCEDCNTAYGELLPHEYTAETVHSSYLATEATCTEQATYYYSCEACGASSKDTADEKTFKHGELLPHVFTNENRKTEDYLHTAKTCTSYAKYYHSCENCEAKGTTTFRDVAGGFAPHNYTAIQKEIYAETSATCTTGGRYYYSCSACGASCKDDTTVENKLFDGEALGHVYRVERVVVSAATCNTPGKYYNKQTCVRCNDSTGDGEITYLETPATGKHTFPAEWDAAASYPATCGKDGLNIKYCTTCSRAEGRVVAALKEILPATGIHDYTGVEWVVTTPATCNKMGKQVRECKNCEHPETESIPVIGHSWLEPQAIVDETTGETTGYNFHYDRLKTPATCVSKAVYYKHCATCGMTMGGETYEFGGVDANGHNFSTEAVYDETDGKYYYVCLNNCGEKTEKACEFVEIPEGTSNEDIIEVYGAVVVNEPTCKAEGLAVIYCKTCGDKHTQSVILAIDPNKHISDDVFTIGEVAATCSTNGSTGTKYYACCYDTTEGADNSDVIKEPAQVITADKTLYAHEDIKDVARVDATCTTAGHEAYQKCDACQTVIGEIVVIPATDHLFTEWTQVAVKDGNDNIIGYNHTRECTNTDCEVTETGTCSGGEATCIADALCATCGQKYADKDSNNHKNIQTKPEVDSTCQAAGYEAYKYCADCSTPDNEVVIGEKKIIPVKDHVFDNNWTQTNVVDGEGNVTEYKHSRTCLTCNIETETEACSGGVAYCNEQATCQACKTKYGATNPDNHKTQSTHNKENDRVEATCTAPGKEADRLYKCCNAVKQAGAVIPQLDHEFTVELTDTKVPANCLDKGSVDYKCANCDATETRELPVDSKNHKSTEILTIGKKAATCTEKGYTGNKYHKCCYDLGKTEAQNKKALIEMGKEIPTNGTHSYSAPVPEYMIATRTESTDENGKVTVTFTYKTTEPTYAEKVAARHADGKWYHVQQCAECGDVLTKACTTYNHTINCVDHDVCDVCKGLCSLIDETSHKFELIKVPGTPATCMADGVKDYYRCGGCEKAYLDKAGKTFVDPDTDAGKAALKIDKSTAQHVINWNSPNEVVTGNCGTSGYKVFYCTVEGCDYEARLDTGVVNTIHTWPTTPDGNYVYVTITPATCGSNGYDAIRCSVCQAIKLNSYVITPATGDHDYDVNKDGKVDKNDAVIVDGEDCQSPGTITYTCTECGHKDVQTDTSGVSAHKWAEDGSDGWKVVGGDCSTGVAYERICLVCGNSEQKTETSGNHDYIEYERVEPTAEKDGYVIYECKNCKFRTDPEVLKYEGNDPVDPENPEVPEIPDDPEVNKHKFNYDEYRVIEEATCQSAEIREYVCLECGEKVRLPFGEMEDHVWLKQPAEKATCDKDGHSEYYRCVRCYTEDPTEPKVIYPATGHNDGDGDGKCDKCSALLYEGDGGASVCSCMCHKTGFMGFIYKIVSFFWKLFKMNPSCACGNTHY